MTPPGSRAGSPRLRVDVGGDPARDPGGVVRRHRHHHGGDGQYDGDERHRLDREQDRLRHRHEAELEGILGLGQCFGQRILERRIDRLRYGGSLIRVLELLDQHADLVAAAGKARLDRLVQVGPMKEHLRFGGGLRRAVVDAAQVERPRARKNSAAQRDLVAYLPSVLLGELAAYDGALAIGEESPPFLRGEHELRINVEISGCVDCELREEIALADVHTPEPIRPRDRGHAGHLTDPLRVGERQREDERYRVARDQPGAGARVGAGVPGVDDRTQQSERADRDHDTEDRECRAQLVSQRVLDDEAKEIHGRYRNGKLTLCRVCKRHGSCGRRHGSCFFESESRLWAGLEPIFAKMHSTKRNYGPRPAVSIYAPFRLLVAVAMALLIATVIASSTAHGMALGNASAQSTLGSPLRAVIPISTAPGELLQAACFRVVPAGDGFPQTVTGRVSLERTASAFQLVVTTGNAVNE